MISPFWNSNLGGGSIVAESAVCHDYALGAGIEMSVRRRPQAKCGGYNHVGAPLEGRGARAAANRFPTTDAGVVSRQAGSPAVS